MVRAGGQWTVLHSLALGEGGNATPAIVDGRLYVRTHEKLLLLRRAGINR